MERLRKVNHQDVVDIIHRKKPSDILPRVVTDLRQVGVSNRLAGLWRQEENWYELKTNGVKK